MATVPRWRDLRRSGHPSDLVHRCTHHLEQKVTNWDESDDEICGEVIAVEGNAVTIRRADGREVTLGKPRRMKPTHIGVAWKYRNTRSTRNAVIHACIRPGDVSAERLPDGRIGWDKPWLRLCDGGPAHERRFGWPTDVTCAVCQKKLGDRKSDL